MNGISSVTLVSDGILVAFDDGKKCYYPASFLQEHIGLGANQLFLDHDTSVHGDFNIPWPNVTPGLLPC